MSTPLSFMHRCHLKNPKGPDTCTITGHWIVSMLGGYLIDVIFSLKNMTFQIVVNFQNKYECSFTWKILIVNRLWIFIAGRICPSNKQIFNQHFDWGENCKFWMNCKKITIWFLYIKLKSKIVFATFQFSTSFTIWSSLCIAELWFP